MFCAVPCGVHRQLHASGGPILGPALRSALSPPGHGVCRAGQWLHLEFHCGLQLLVSPGTSLWLAVTCFAWNFTVAYSYLLFHLELHHSFHRITCYFTRNFAMASSYLLFHLELCHGLELLVISPGILPWLRVTCYFTWNFAMA